MGLFFTRLLFINIFYSIYSIPDLISQAAFCAYAVCSNVKIFLLCSIDRGRFKDLKRDGICLTHLIPFIGVFLNKTLLIGPIQGREGLIS